MTVVRRKEQREAGQEGFIPAGKGPLMAFVAGMLTLLLLTGWLCHLL